MNANELMINDFVMHRGEPIMVYEIDDYNERINTEPDGYNAITCVEISEITPIPLTTEIIENNGWRKIGRRTYIDEQNCVLANHHDDKWQMSYSGIDDYTATIPNIRYVHELQHALRLCKINPQTMIRTVIM